MVGKKRMVFQSFPIVISLSQATLKPWLALHSSSTRVFPDIASGKDSGLKSPLVQSVLFT
jgi:hypothetical protein